MRRTAAVVVSVFALTLALMAPASADHLTETAHQMELTGFAHLHGTGGFNTDVWPQVTDDGRAYAYVGTWGTVRLDGSEDCPSTSDNPSSPSQSGVRIIDVTDHHTGGRGGPRHGERGAEQRRQGGARRHEWW